jgi:hypothetical protein
MTKRQSFSCNRTLHQCELDLNQRYQLVESFKYVTDNRNMRHFLHFWNLLLVIMYLFKMESSLKFCVELHIKNYPVTLVWLNTSRHIAIINLIKIWHIHQRLKFMKKKKLTFSSRSKVFNLVSYHIIIPVTSVILPWHLQHHADVLCHPNNSRCNACKILTRQKIW